MKYCQEKMRMDLAIVNIIVENESLKTGLIIPVTSMDKLGLMGI